MSENEKDAYIPEEVLQEKTFSPPNPTIKECIQLNQLLPIMDIDKNIDAISSVIYENDDLLNEFLQKVDNRIKICKDDPQGDFIICEQNRDGDNYRSPISNKYFPSTEEDAKYPSSELRNLEEKLNKMFKLYVKFYYNNSNDAISSVYCWELEENIKNGFGVAVLIKNLINDNKNLNFGNWDSASIVTVTFTEEDEKIKANYNLTATVNLAIKFDHEICGKVGISGTIAKSSHYSKIVSDYVNDDSHVENIGVLVEDMENSIRNIMTNVYCKKSKEIIDTARYNPVLGKPNIKQSEALKQVWISGTK